MGLKCQYCGEELPSYPEEEVENNQLEEIVGHKHGKDTDSLAITTKDYFCDPECLSQAYREGEIA